MGGNLPNRTVFPSTTWRFVTRKTEYRRRVPLAACCQCRLLDDSGMSQSPGHPSTHRKLVLHFDEPGKAHELTFSCRVPLAACCQCRLLDDSGMSQSPGQPSTHRKLVRHFDEPGKAHELTFSCYQRLPLLNTDERRTLLSGCIDSALARHGFELIAFVFMPEHVHLIVWPLGHATISRLLFAIKKPFSFRAKTHLAARQDPLLEKLTIRERPNKIAFRFWQEGGGYDRNIHNGKTLRQAIE